ncbi:MAG: LacI family DNA-binding transcriptional regulator, partial [Sphingomonadaceae bacterium]
MDEAEKPKRRQRAPRRGSGETTVADVARQAGVSPMTVSRVINHAANVLPATRARVEAAIAELDFVPNPAARSLAGRPQCRIALLHSNPSAAYLSEFLVGSLAGAAESDAQLVVEHWNGSDSPMKLAARLADHRI